MADILATTYPWTKVLHIVSMVAWMAGLFYLPRLFVYHAETAVAGSPLSETFKTMERKLFRQIMNPAMIATWTFGLLLAFTPGIVDWSSGWILREALRRGGADGVPPLARATGAGTSPGTRTACPAVPTAW